MRDWLRCSIYSIDRQRPARTNKRTSACRSKRPSGFVEKAGDFVCPQVMFGEYKSIQQASKKSVRLETLVVILIATSWGSDITNPQFQNSCDVSTQTPNDSAMHNSQHPVRLVRLQHAALLFSAIALCVLSLALSTPPEDGGENLVDAGGSSVPPWKHASPRWSCEISAFTPPG